MKSQEPTSLEAPVPPPGPQGRLGLSLGLGLVAALGILALLAGAAWLALRSGQTAQTQSAQAGTGPLRGELLEAPVAGPQDPQPPEASSAEKAVSNRPGYRALDFTELSGFLYEDPNALGPDLLPVSPVGTPKETATGVLGSAGPGGTGNTGGAPNGGPTEAVRGNPGSGGKLFGSRSLQQVKRPEDVPIQRTLTRVDAAAGNPMGSRKIPEKILAYSGQQVAVKGYMVPLKTDGGRVKTFLIVRSQMLCCYGQMPRLNEMIYVEMPANQSCDFFPDIPTTVYGTLTVGEEIKDGIVLSIYRMVAAQVEGPLDL